MSAIDFNDWLLYWFLEFDQGEDWTDVLTIVLGAELIDAPIQLTRGVV